MKSFALAALLLLFSAVPACTHSRLITIIVTNTSTEKVSTVVIEYPEASFGINALEPGKTYEYKIKPTATGALKIQFSNARGINRVSTGPMVRKNDEGVIQIRVTQDAASSEAKLN